MLQIDAGVDDQRETFGAVSSMGILLLLFGVVGICLFHAGTTLPILVSGAAIVLSAWHMTRLYMQARVGPLMLLLFLSYALPFIHVFPYIWFNFDAPPPSRMWGFAVNPYMTDKPIIELMAMIGAVGVAALAGAASLPRGRAFLGFSGRDIVRPGARTLSILALSTWVAIAFFLSWVSAPTDTIFTAIYSQSRSLSSEWNFSSTMLFSYCFLVFALADSMFESSPRVRRLKQKIVLVPTLVIIFWFQLLRGDRESFTFILAAMLMYYGWGPAIGLFKSSKFKLKWSWTKRIAFTSVLIVLAYVVSVVRSELVGVRSGSEVLAKLVDLESGGVFRIDNLLSGTWSGALLTPLSVAGDYVNGSLQPKNGQTYLDLISSMMPGFLADWLDYVRPIDAFNGPAWEMTYGQGGTHAAVVPFMNFQMAGVFVITALWSFGFAKMERHAIKRPTVSHLALLGITAMAVPHWLWYGEKNIINGLILWLMLSIVYRLQLGHGRANPAVWSYAPAASLRDVDVNT